MASTTPINLETEYPSIDLAFKASEQSYDIAQRRFDAIEGRVQSLLLFATTITLAIPAIIKSSNPGISLNSCWLACAIAVYFIAISLGTYTRLRGSLSLVTPKKLYEKFLGFSEAEFKRRYIYYAGVNFEENTYEINLKGHLLNCVALLFALEGLFWAAWVFSLP